MRRVNNLFVLTAIAVQLTLFACIGKKKGSYEGPASKDALKAAAQIDETTIRAHTKFMGSDLFEGRGPGTRGDHLTQEYLSTQMQMLGLKPGAPDGSWYQKIPLVGMKTKAPEVLTVSSKDKSVDLKFYDDYIAVSATQNEVAKIENAEIVFVGHGIVAPEYEWNDFKGLDVNGKVLLVMNNDPKDDPDLFEGKKRLYYGRWDYKYEQAAKMGAIGAIIIHTTPSASYGWNVVQTSWSGEQFALKRDDSPKLEMEAWATDEASKKITGLAGKNLDELRKLAFSKDFKPVPLGVTLSAVFTNKIQKTHSASVIGKIEGSDKKLRNEGVFYTAHHDHLGMKDNGKEGEDIIYNGALDNASGVATLLAVAKAFKTLQEPPKRSIYFVFVGAEEQGLLGSEYFAKNPSIPPGRMAANINVDGAAIFGRTKDISVIGLGKSNIDREVKAIAHMQKRIVKSDEFPDAGYFYRSDQFNFAKVGVPAFYMHSGTTIIGKPEGWGKEQKQKYTKQSYHQPSDEYKDSWDLSGAVEDAQLYFYVGLNVANADEMPSWNKGDEFEAARLKAIADLKSQ